MNPGQLTAQLVVVFGALGLALLTVVRLRPGARPRRPSFEPPSADSRGAGVVPTDSSGPGSVAEHEGAIDRDVGRWAGVVAAIVLVAAIALGSVVVAVTTIVCGLVVHGTAPRRRQRRRRRAITSTMPEVLDLVIVCIEAGHSPLAAIRLLHPIVPPVVGRPLAEVIARVDRGERFADALAVLSERLGPEVLGFVDALVQTERAGLAFGPGVERLAHDARDHRRRLAESAARELPVRLSFPLVLCTLPSFVLVAIVPLLVGALSSIRVV